MVDLHTKVHRELALLLITVLREAQLDHLHVTCHQSAHRFQKMQIIYGCEHGNCTGRNKQLLNVVSLSLKMISNLSEVLRSVKHLREEEVVSGSGVALRDNPVWIK